MSLLAYSQIKFRDFRFSENLIPTFFAFVLRKDVKIPIPKYRLKEIEYPVSTYDLISGVNNVFRCIFSVKGFPCKKGMYFRQTYSLNNLGIGLPNICLSVIRNYPVIEMNRITNSD